MSSFYDPGSLNPDKEHSVGESTTTIEVYFVRETLFSGVNTDHDGVIYDLDGTLVTLTVDWDAVRDDVVSVYETAGIAAEEDLWTLFSDADEYGLRTEVEETIAAHERDGARRSERLPLADTLTATERATAVCSLNCEAACHIALDRHGLAETVSTVVGRDTTGAYKPDPQPLEHAIDTLGLTPENALFVGDSERDAVTAKRAGVEFRYVEDVRLST
jgi:phosphoglycolate phosphatase